MDEDKQHFQKSSNLLSLKQLSKTFKSDLFEKERQVVSDLSCDFPKGKCTGLLGHNGAGKTTTIRMILGLIATDNGQIFFNNENLTYKERRSIGYMPETNKLPALLTPQEILNFQLKTFSDKHLSRSERKNLIEQQLKQVDLWDHRNKKVKHLSKGMGRKLAWSYAIIHQPPLLILDEPFSGLDPLGRKQMQTWIEQAKRTDKTVILCTHELWSVEALCDEVHIMRKGKLVYSTLSEKSDNSAIKAEGLYSLHVSGAKKETLEKLKSELKLSDWLSMEGEGWLSKLQFSDYSGASKWLSACLSKGFVVVHFGSEGLIKEHNLLQYFKGDLVQ